MAERIAQYTGQIYNVSLVYNIYRIVLPLVLLVTYITSPTTTMLGEYDATLFVQVSTGYAIFAVLLAFLNSSFNNFLQQPNILGALIVADILFLTLIVFSSGGIISGLGLLLIVTVASGSILIRGRISTFLAAVAALSLIYSELYLALVLEDASNQLFQAGILGVILFATSLYIQTVTTRIYNAAVLADKQASNILDLEKLNNEIIQRMRTGVVVVDPDLRIITMNSAARSTLSPLFKTTEPDDPEVAPVPLPEEMANQLNLWKINPKRQPQPISIPDTNKQVQINFAFLNPSAESDILIFLEDNRQIVQRVRQMKLASLGRLTASIAHEVRNPLGAISHASQLLKESASFDPNDQRMLEIILDHCSRINLIIQDVLDASRHDDTSARKLNLKAWLERFVANYTATHENCDHIDLKVTDETTEINVIDKQLEQVLSNLIENGLRYSKKQTGQAVITVEAGNAGSGDDIQPFIHIIDEGPGIDEENEANLFEPFHTTEASGTGLGLYISKELCEANQSQLTYRRTAQGKSCFSIYFSHPERSMM